MENRLRPAWHGSRPDQRLEDALTWRVPQWQWVPEVTEDEDEDDEEEWGEWALRGHSPIDAAAGAERLPESPHVVGAPPD
jgi:hypothetical protein